MRADVCVVMTTAGSDAMVERIVSALLDGKLAACVQILPIRSVYVWNDARTESAEQLLLIKARRTDFAAIERAIRATHDYDVPEILCLDVAAASVPYLDWLSAVTEHP